VGTLPVLITIECRDRSKDEDVTWIEQVAQKRESIGAAITVAVSSSGFSAPALTKAAQLGVATRTLTDATAGDLVSWLRTQVITFDFERWWIEHVRLDLYDAPIGWSFDEGAQEQLKTLGARAPIIIRNSDNAPGSMEDILRIWEAMNGRFFPKDMPADGKEHHGRIAQAVERGVFHVRTGDGPRDVRQFEIILGFLRTETEITVARMREYADPNGPLVQSAEWELPERMRLLLHRDLKSGQTKIVVSAERVPQR
jgi:hypothetical protein